MSLLRRSLLASIAPLLGACRVGTSSEVRCPGEARVGDTIGARNREHHGGKRQVRREEPSTRRADPGGPAC